MTASDLESRAALLDRVLHRADAHDESLAQLAADDPGSSPVVDDADVLPLAKTLARLLTPWTKEEFEAARSPDPHAFERGHFGLFPVDEVSVIASAGREGKTTNLIAIGTAQVIGHSLVDLWPRKNRCVIVYSAEDLRKQYARKVAAQASILSASEAALVMERLIVPDLEDPEFAPMRALIKVADGQPCPTSTVTAVIEALRPVMASDVPIGLLVFETVSTVSEAEETNAGLRALVDAMKRISRALSVPVLLSHHVSQASLVKLQDLDLSTADIRGGTALIGNARQAGMVVNLGSDAMPYPDNDARTILRMLVAPGEAARITMLVTLDSSKGITPPPVFFRWVDTDFGPAAVELPAPAALLDKSWQQVQQMIRAARAEKRQDAREERAEAAAKERLQRVLVALAKLQQDAPEKPVTERQIRDKAGVSKRLLEPALDSAEREGLIQSYETTVRGKQVTAYRLKGDGTDAR